MPYVAASTRPHPLQHTCTATAVFSDLEILGEDFQLLGWHFWCSFIFHGNIITVSLFLQLHCLLRFVVDFSTLVFAPKGTLVSTLKIPFSDFYLKVQRLYLKVRHCNIVTERQNKMERERAMVRKEMIEFLRLLSNCSVLQPLSFMMNSNPGFKSQFVRVELPGPPPDALAWKGGLDRHARKTKSQVLLAALLRKIFRRQLATRLQFVRSTCVRSVTKLTQHFAKETGFFKHFPFISDQLFNQYLVRLQPLATLTFTGRNRGSGKRT